MKPKYKPQLKHKAQHGGYKKKPAKKQVKALLGLYAAIGGNSTPERRMLRPGVQLKLF